MNIVNKIELKLEGYDKCHMICDNDCTLGSLFDYAKCLEVFIIKKIQEQQPEQKVVEMPTESEVV